MAENEVALFEKNNLVVFQRLAEFKKVKDEMEAQEAKLKEALEKSMQEHGIKSFKNDYVTLSYVEASTSETIDLKAFKEKEPKLYDELLGDYRKVTNRKAYVKIQVK